MNFYENVENLVLAFLKNTKTLAVWNFQKIFPTTTCKTLWNKTYGAYSE